MRPPRPAGVAGQWPREPVLRGAPIAGVVAGAGTAQIFVIGLAFGHLARKYSVEASAVAHVTLNALAMLIGLVVPYA